MTVVFGLLTVETSRRSTRNLDALTKLDLKRELCLPNSLCPRRWGKSQANVLGLCGCFWLKIKRKAQDWIDQQFYTCGCFGNNIVRKISKFRPQFAIVAVIVTIDPHRLRFIQKRCELAGCAAEKHNADSHS